MQQLDFSYLIRYSIIFLIALLLTQCANIKTPTGGPKDTRPPQIDSTKAFTPNLSVNFTDKEILLPFDEWVVLKDVAKNIVISPPLANPLEISLKKKTVVIDLLEEKLRENTTYTINFGEAIQDLTEGNTPKDFRFIFATGPYIDSLSVQGTVRDAFTNELKEDIFVILYDNLEDSVVRKERPYYFAKTDKTGRFSIPNVKQDTFKIFALMDNNFNYLFDIENEPIGFLNQNIITTDSLQESFELQLFKEEGVLKLMRPVVEHYGHTKLILNKPLTYNLSVTVENKPADIIDKVHFENDTIHYWYANASADSLIFIVENLKGWKDTITVQMKDQTNLDSTNLKFQLAKKSSLFVKQNPDQPITLSFNHPFISLDSSKVIWSLDSTIINKTVLFTIDEIDPKVINFTNTWKEKGIYELMILPYGTMDIFGLENQDTIKLTYQIEERKRFGNVIATVENLDTAASYIIQLLTKSDQLIGEFLATQKATATHKFLSVKATDYKLRVIEDKNKNGRWDTGKYPTLQPEPLFLMPSAQNLRPNWELDLKLSIQR